MPVGRPVRPSVSQEKIRVISKPKTQRRKVKPRRKEKRTNQKQSGMQFHGHVLLEKLQNAAVDLPDALPLLGPNAEHGAPNVLEYRKAPAFSGPVGIAYEALTQVCLPVLVLAIGLISSIAALTTVD